MSAHVEWTSTPHCNARTAIKGEWIGEHQVDQPAALVLSDFDTVFVIEGTVDSLHVLLDQARESLRGSHV